MKNSGVNIRSYMAGMSFWNKSNLTSGVRLFLSLKFDEIETETDSDVPHTRLDAVCVPLSPNLHQLSMLQQDDMTAIIVGCGVIIATIWQHCCRYAATFIHTHTHKHNRINQVDIK